MMIVQTSIKFLSKRKIGFFFRQDFIHVKQNINMLIKQTPATSR